MPVTLTESKVCGAVAVTGWAAPPAPPVLATWPAALATAGGTDIAVDDINAGARIIPRAFGFALPVGATVVKVEVSGRAHGGTGTQTFWLTSNGTTDLAGSNAALVLTAGPPHVAFGPLDITPDVVPTVAEVNGIPFGIRVNTSPSCRWDQITLTVTYDVPGLEALAPPPTGAIAGTGGNYNMSEQGLKPQEYARASADAFADAETAARVQAEFTRRFWEKMRNRGWSAKDLGRGR